VGTGEAYGAAFLLPDVAPEYRKKAAIDNATAEATRDAINDATRAAN
jgi:hypothetical protein